MGFFNVSGILAQAASLQDGDSYIFSAYVKFIEQAGALVVPLRYDLTEETWCFIVSFKTFFKPFSLLIPFVSIPFYSNLFLMNKMFDICCGSLKILIVGILMVNFYVIVSEDIEVCFPVN